MPRGPTLRSGRLSKKASGEAGGAQARTSGRRSTVVGRGRSALGPKAGDEASVGAGRHKTCRSVQKGLQVDLSLRFRQARERRGLLADSADGKHRALLDGTLGVRSRGGSQQGAARTV